MRKGELTLEDLKNVSGGAGSPMNEQEWQIYLDPLQTFLVAEPDTPEEAAAWATVQEFNAKMKAKYGIN